MGRTQGSNRHRAQAIPKVRIKTRNEIEELREENRQLRELVAHLSKLALERITETAEPREQSTSAKRSQIHNNSVAEHNPCEPRANRRQTAKAAVTPFHSALLLAARSTKSARPLEPVRRGLAASRPRRPPIRAATDRH